MPLVAAPRRKVGSPGQGASHLRTEHFSRRTRDKRPYRLASEKRNLKAYSPNRDRTGTMSTRMEHWSPRVPVFRRNLSPPLQAVGCLVVMSAEAVRFLFRRPFQARESVEQSWFVARVAMMPTLLAAIPSTVLVSFTLNILLRELGAADLSGAGAAFGAVTQIGPLVTVLVVAGAGATAICADLGSRTIREEIEALEVLGINPVQRLVTPRMLASGLVALLLNSLVCIIGILGGYVFSVFVQNVNPGAFSAGMTVLTGLPELIISGVKAALFGLTAGLVAC